MLTILPLNGMISSMSVEPLSLARYVRSLTGRPPHAARPEDWLAAIAAAVREHVMSHWVGTGLQPRAGGGKRVYYLSMEFLPGRVLLHALMNLGLHDACRRTLAEHGVDLDELAELEVEPALGNGGLGRLAACLLDSMANLGLSACGYGIRYGCGLFSQQIRDGWQVERPDLWLDAGSSWELPRRDLVYRVKFGGRVMEPHGAAHGRRDWVDTDEVLATAYDLPVPGYRSQRVGNLRLWAPRAAHEFDLKSFNDGDHGGAFSRKNAIESLSQVLYPGDATLSGRELRFKQEFFFVSASIQDILRRFRRRHESFDRLPDEIAIQINDTHPSLAIAELMRLLIDEHGCDFERAWHITRQCFAYTNHTLMPEALEVWPVRFFETLLPRHLQIVYDINDWHLRRAASRRPDDGALLRRISLVNEDGERSIRMAHLAVVGSHKVNGVSKMHTALMQQTIFADFHALDPAKIVNVTNGITFRRWLHAANPDLTRLISSRIGERWLTHADDLAQLAPHAEDPAFRAAFRTVKRDNKKRLAELIARECNIAAEVDSLFDVQVKRIHEYKRQLLNLLHVVALYRRLREGRLAGTLARTVIFAGKAAPGYAVAKLTVKLIHDVAAIVNGDPAMTGRLKVVFIADYGVGKAQKIIPAADLSEQISTAGYEASGTGNMKLALNGALTIGTLDGANIEIREAVGEENFFLFGADAADVARLRAGRYDPSAFYHGDPELKGALDLVASGHFSPSQPDLFKPIVDALIQHDPYLVLADFAAYRRCQERVEALYGDVEEWSRRAILNVAGVGEFSSDRAVQQYMQRVWNMGAPSPHAAPEPGVPRALETIG
jgi:glycogen phosphorylase